MKHLFFALVIALLSASAATTAWSQQTEPTEQETKDSIVNIMNFCGDLREVEFDEATLHLRIYDTGEITLPVHKLDEALAIDHDESLKFICKETEGRCILSHGYNESSPEEYSEMSTNACPDDINVVLSGAFNHLIGIYDARSPNP